MNEIAKHIKALSGNTDSDILIIGKVLSVDELMRTCDLERLDGAATLYEVMLQPIESGKGVVLIPVVGSYVLVAIFNYQDARVLGIVEPNVIDLKLEELILNIDTRGISLKNKGQDLTVLVKKQFDLFGDLCATIAGAKVSTPTGPGTMMPDVITKLNKLKSESEATFKNLNKILK
jgi:hypothetical protein